MMRTAIRFAILLVLSAMVLPAAATVPAPQPDQDSGAAYHQWLRGGPAGDREPPPYLGPFNYLREYVQMTDFLATWQLADPDSSDYGGMIEAEGGYLGGVIQTDNTLEAIWCWSRYKQWSGRDTYDENIDAAWVYCTRYPAWLEEGATGDNYYRAHNCAWGLTAVLMYKAATGDDSYDGYAETCAQYIVDHALDIWGGTVWTQRLNFFVKGWCAGNLYLYGEAIGNAGYMAEAVVQGQDVLDWINVNPTLNLGLEYWAMSSGTSMWGVCNSVFRDDPFEGLIWLGINAGYMDIWQDYYDVPGYDWDGAWNVAYCNAHFAVWDILGLQAYWDNGQYIADGLLSYDTDDDGGIVAESTDPVTEDMSWVSCYLIKFGVDRLMGEPNTHDVGVLRFVEPYDGQEFNQGERITVKVIGTNYGLQDELAVDMNFSGVGMPGVLDPVDLHFATLDTLTLFSDYLLYEAGDFTLTVTTGLAGDEDNSNDGASIAITVHDMTAVPGNVWNTLDVSVTRNPFRAETGFRFGLASEANVSVRIFDIQGRVLRTLGNGELPAGLHTLAWDGRDDAGRDLPAGLYLYRVSDGIASVSGKVLRLR